MWDRVKFIVENLRTIMFAGIVAWVLIVLSLQLAGFIDIQAQCPGDRCTKLIEWAIKSAEAAPLNSTPHGAPVVFRVGFLPDH